MVCLLFCIKIKIYKTIILAVVFVEEGHKLRVFENMVLKRIFGPKKCEKNMGLRKIS
jgi:hypothetical protein